MNYKEFGDQSLVSNVTKTKYNNKSMKEIYLNHSLIINKVFD